ncbi:hypothetical protein [Plantactinospora endophytica]|uniref:Uncharacterized protein n=1 Tax=Plantactinospora endophytica TaxID=673535 RepID=A0ABQ4EEZ1_9ACTN|nr:hypothetical protein [Plantactinospora endophytica]GIG93285.1 hypothetical protein Pen02_82210 [Plantactinospora endophytica]
MTEAVGLRAGMIISVRMRRDVVVVDPDRFLAAARQALRDRDPGLTDAEAVDAIADVYDAVHVLLDRDGALAADAVDSERVGVGGSLPGVRVADRPDGLSPAGWLQQVVLNDPQPLQDYGCFLPEDPFAVPRIEGSR